MGPATIQGFTVKTLVLISWLILGGEQVEQPTVLIVIGAPGLPEYGERFSQWADRWESAAGQAGAKSLRIGDGPATKKTDLKHLQALLAAEQTESAEPLWLVLLGHGTFDGRTARFNLRGRDISATELAEWLAPFERPLVVINCASASAPFINRLSGPDRVLVTATKSGYEHSYARFGDYLSTAIADPAADLDKDKATSLLEAFLAASGRVAEFYEQEARLATETALIDDNGDGLGTPAEWFWGTRATRSARGGSRLDGPSASRLYLISSSSDQNMPRDVRVRRDELERAVVELRDGKGPQTNEDEYYAKLEPLLVELARLYATLDKRADSPE